MELDTTEKTILALLSSSLTGRKAELPADVNWEDVYREAEAQAVTPLLAAVLPPTLTKDERAKWERRSGQYFSFFYQLLEEQDRLVCIFHQAQIPLLILKGSAAAIYYPESALRTMGDVDFIVPQDRFDEAAALMESRGYTPCAEDKSEEHGHGRHKEYTRGGVSFELHHHFSDLFDMEDYIRDALAHPAEGELEGYRFPMPPALDNGIVLLSHMSQHLKIKMGLRQVLDWMMYVGAVLDDASWANGFSQAAKAIGMDKLAVTATRMCQKYLGLSEEITWCADADEDLCDALLKSLFASGNFARKVGRESDLEGALNGFRRKGLFRFLQQRGSTTWKALERHPWLRPFAWLYQIFRYLHLTFKRGLTVGQMKESTSSSKQFNRMLHELGLE